jgi:hypothetical protein
MLDPSSRNRKFESISLQRRVRSEPCLIASAAAARDRSADHAGKERSNIPHDPGRPDQARSKTLRLTEAGAARFREAVKEWAQAQRQFEAVFGAERTIDLRALLHAVAATDLGTNAVSSEE